MDTDTKKILIAEDDPDLRDALQTALDATGFTVVVTKDGEEALHAYREESPDLVLLDLDMPKRNGLEVLEEIRTDEGGARVPVTILTAHSALGNVAEVTAIGGMHTDFFSKTDKKLGEIVAHIRMRLSEQ